ncbi:MAG: phytanoyl-CoA dioxygenase family protein [Pseudonocardiaceae bacterium]
MIPVADPAELGEHVAAFTEHGFVHFRSVFSPAQVEIFHQLYERAVADWRFANGTDDHPGAVGGLLERFPREVYPALTDPVLLGFTEAVMGPFVQLDSSVLNGDPPVSAEQHGQPVMWHRDRSGSVPPGVYVRPASIVFLSYLQQMTDAVGPLRVVPGSHRQSRLLSDDELHVPLSAEILVRAEAGDVVATHHNLLHSGTRNTSDRERRFFGFIYNLSILRQEDNFAGSNCRAFVESAKRTNDRRLMRLLGEDPLIFPRQNSGFTDDAERDWKRWHEEDAEFAHEAADAATRSHWVRAALAAPSNAMSVTPQAPGPRPRGPLSA